MSNQMQTPMLAIPQRIPFWMLATTTISTVLTLGFWIGGIVYTTRKPIGFPQREQPEVSNAGRPLSRTQQSDLSEIDRLEAWLNLIDREN